MKIAFFGHRKIEKREKIRSITTAVIAKLIAQGADTFLFGSRSEFDSLCHEIVSEFKRNNPQLKRVYVRAEYEFIKDDYTSYLLEQFESTFFPKAAFLFPHTNSFLSLLSGEPCEQAPKEPYRYRRRSEGPEADPQQT